MQCTTCTSAVVGSAAVETAMCADALKSIFLSLLLHVALMLSVEEHSAKFYLVH